MTFVAVALGVWLSGGMHAQAKQPSKAETAEAQRRFQRATELYEEENNLPGALAEFRRAYAVAPNYRVLYNIGQLCFLVQDYPCALDAFSRYLSEGGAEVPAQRREEVQRDVTRLQTRVAKLRIVSDKPGAEVVIDNVAVGKTPLADPVMVGAGRPQVRVTLAGYAPFTRVVEVASMETANVQVELLPLTAGSVAEPLPPAITTLGRDDAPAVKGTPVLPWVITGALAAGAATTGALALKASSDLKSLGERPQMNPNQLPDKSKQVKRFALATDILLGATVVSAVISTYLSFSGSKPARGESVSLVVGPGSIGLTGRY